MILVMVMVMLMLMTTTTTNDTGNGNGNDYNKSMYTVAFCTGTVIVLNDVKTALLED